MDISIMFFGAEDGDGQRHAAKFRDIIAIARVADSLGFSAVWTPERHFQDFGQVFPSPAVLGAALAVATERIAVRAGSVVLPLHHPLRVVEDWSVVDNLSGGRVGVAIATGWHSTDFVLAPDKYADRRSHVLEGVPLLRQLWAGEPMTLLDGTGKNATVRPRPQPYSPRLPIWLTASGSEETWVAAGRLRANVLSATAGQTRAELAAKICRYREEYEAAPRQPGTAERGIVTLMAHTYLDTHDEDAVRRVAHPLRSYLRSYAMQTASSSRASANNRKTTMTTDIDLLTEFALRRYLAWGSLIGSPQTCARSLADLAEVGCDEVACFIDFGLDREDVLASLHLLADARKELVA
jgi:natural product biosynthesis luciferase-like monooxygenase protein